MPPACEKSSRWADAAAARHCRASSARYFFSTREAMPNNHGRADSHESSKLARRRNATRNVSLSTSSTASTPTRRRMNAATAAACRSNNPANADGESRDRRRISLSVLTLGIARSSTKPSQNLQLLRSCRQVARTTSSTTKPPPRARSAENDRLRRISRLVPGCHAGNVLRNVLLADVIGGSMGAATSTVATGRRGPSWRDRVHVL